MFLIVSVLPLYESNTYYVEHGSRTQRSMAQYSAKIWIKYILCGTR